MYFSQYCAQRFDHYEGLVSFLNSNNIPKENIIAIIKDSPYIILIYFRT